MKPLRHVPHAPAGESGSGGGGAGGTLAQAKQSIADGAREATAKVKSAVSNTAARAKAEAERVATEKKTTAADRIGGYSSAIHDSARALEDQDPNIAWFTHRAAERLEGVADYMRNRDFNGLRTDVEGFARRHPAVFFGGLFFAGLMLGNVVKAGRDTAAADEGDQWEPEGQGGDGEMSADGPASSDTSVAPDMGL
jgi:hypothetical protein